MKNNVSAFWNELDLFSDEIQGQLINNESNEIIGTNFREVGFVDRYMQPVVPNFSKKDFLEYQELLANGKYAVATEMLTNFMQFCEQRLYGIITEPKQLERAARAMAWSFGVNYAKGVIHTNKNWKADRKEYNQGIKEVMLYFYHYIIKDYYEQVHGVDIMPKEKKRLRSRSKARRRRK